MTGTRRSRKTKKRGQAPAAREPGTKSRWCLARAACLRLIVVTVARPKALVAAPEMRGRGPPRASGQQARARRAHVFEPESEAKRSGARRLIRQGVRHEAESLAQLVDQLLGVLEQARELAELPAEHLDRHADGRARRRRECERLPVVPD